MGFFGKIGQGLKKTRDSLMNSVSSVLKGFTRIDDELFEELEEILVMGDVGANTAARICEQLRAQVKAQGVTDPMAIRGMMCGIVSEMLEGGQELVLNTKPAVILVIGVNGVVTFKKSTLPEVLKEVPLERLVLETDSPYLAPVPFRGKRNESAYVGRVAARLAELYGTEIGSVERKTAENALKVFKIREEVFKKY